MKTLAVYFNGTRIGTLSQDISGKIAFQYDQEWLRGTGAHPISQSLPLGAETFSEAECIGFFGGLLPEENIRIMIAKNLGITPRNDYAMLREIGGAREIHMRISSPPTIGPCFYGIDTPTRQELIAHTHTVEEIKKYITADSLSYLQLDGLKRLVKNPEDYCCACFDNISPISFPGEHLQQMELIL